MCVYYLFFIAAAIVTYGFYTLYMIVMTFYSSAEPTIGTVSMTIKKVCTILGLGSLVTLAVLSILLTTVIAEHVSYCILCLISSTKLYIGVMGESRTYLAICEW